jgi:hypothetical protein
VSEKPRHGKKQENQALPPCPKKPDTENSDIRKSISKKEQQHVVVVDLFKKELKTKIKEKQAMKLLRLSKKHGKT